MDAFIRGTNNTRIRELVMTKPNITFTEAVEIAVDVEAANKFTKMGKSLDHESGAPD